jgi:hypothetical protein
MPYTIKKRGSQYCVTKDSDGKTMGCHSSRTKAERQRRALYAAEASEEGSTTVNSMEPFGTTASMSSNLRVQTSPVLTAAQAAQAIWDLATTNVIAEEEENREPWDGVLATVMSPTDDGRIIESSIDFRDMPVPFSVQLQRDEGHKGSFVCGRIEGLEFIPFEDFDRKSEFDMDEVRDGAVVVYGRGTLDASEYAEEAKRLLANGAGVSLDGLHFTGNLFNSEDLAEVDVSEMDMGEIFENVMNMTFLRGMAGKISGVTVVDTPAFVEATVMVASAAVQPKLRFGLSTLTASAAGLAPLAPPKDWFFMEEPDEPTPWTVMKDGRVFGHLALWETCHASFASCERAPRSLSNYAWFHTGQIETDEGELIDIGRVTVGKEGTAKGGHASLVLGRKGAMEHYEKTGCVGAFVRAVDGRHGIWLSGVVRSDAPAERVRDMRANPLSGDWRDYELVAALAVPCGGLPIPRAQARLVASAGGEEEVPAFIATEYTQPILMGEGELTEETEGAVEVEMVEGWTFPCEGIDVLSYRRGIKKLKKRRMSLEADE